MSITKTRARLAALTEQASWLKAQRAAAIADHAAGIGGAADRVAMHGGALTALTAELDLEHEALEHLGEVACKDTEVTRRAAARQAAADAVAAWHDNLRLAAEVDAAVDALSDAMRAHTSKSAEAADLGKRALKLAIPSLADRASAFAMVPHTGMFAVAGASALREIFEGVDSPHHIFEPAPGLTLPVGHRLPFAEAAAWQTRTSAASLVATVDRACKAEEAVVAELQSRDLA